MSESQIKEITCQGNTSFPCFQGDDRSTSPTLSKTTTLCIEIGGTRIKACLLEDGLTCEKLREIHTFVVMRQPNDQAKLACLFQKNRENPLFPFLAHAHYSKIAVSIKGAVYTDTIVPNSLVATISKALSALENAHEISGISLQNDAVCFASGALLYQRLKGSPAEFPCLAITLGTGVGVAFCHDESTITNIQIGDLFVECPLTALQEYTMREQKLPVSYWNVHKCLGAEYFTWRFAQKPFQDAEMTPHLSDYNERFQIFIKELLVFIKNRFKIDSLSIMIGGGFSRFIQIPTSFPYKTYLLNPCRLQDENTPPDILPLMGAKNVMKGSSLDILPPYNILIERREALARQRALLTKALP